jgi:hypothetical protein
MVDSCLYLGSEKGFPVGFECLSDSFDALTSSFILLKDRVFYVYNPLLNEAPRSLFDASEKWDIIQHYIRVRISLDEELLAFQLGGTAQSKHGDVYIVTVGGDISHTIRIKQSGWTSTNAIVPPGLVWSDHGGHSADLVILTKQGLQLYKVSVVRQQCKLSRVVPCVAQHYVYEPINRLILGVNDGTGSLEWTTGPKRERTSVISPFFLITEVDNSIRLELPPPDAVSPFECKSEPRDVNVVILYDEVFVSVVTGRLCNRSQIKSNASHTHDSIAIDLYPMYRSGSRPQGAPTPAYRLSIPDLPTTSMMSTSTAHTARVEYGQLFVSILDSLLLVHVPEDGSIYCYDIGCSSSKTTSNLFICEPLVHCNTRIGRPPDGVMFLSESASPWTRNRSRSPAAYVSLGLNSNTPSIPTPTPTPVPTCMVNGDVCELYSSGLQWLSHPLSSVAFLPSKASQDAVVYHLTMHLPVLCQHVLFSNNKDKNTSMVAKSGTGTDFTTISTPASRQGEGQMESYDHYVSSKASENVPYHQIVYVLSRRGIPRKGQILSKSYSEGSLTSVSIVSDDNNQNSGYFIESSIYSRTAKELLIQTLELMVTNCLRLHTSVLSEALEMIASVYLERLSEINNELQLMNTTHHSGMDNPLESHTNGQQIIDWLFNALETNKSKTPNRSHPKTPSTYKDNDININNAFIECMGLQQQRTLSGYLVVTQSELLYHCCLPVLRASILETGEERQRGLESVSTFISLMIAALQCQDVPVLPILPCILVLLTAYASPTEMQPLQGLQSLLASRVLPTSSIFANHLVTLGLHLKKTMPETKTETETETVLLSIIHEGVSMLWQYLEYARALRILLSLGQVKHAIRLAELAGSGTRAAPRFDNDRTPVALRHPSSLRLMAGHGVDTSASVNDYTDILSPDSNTKVDATSLTQSLSMEQLSVSEKDSEWNDQDKHFEHHKDIDVIDVRVRRSGDDTVDEDNLELCALNKAVPGHLFVAAASASRRAAVVAWAKGWDL